MTAPSERCMLSSPPWSICCTTVKLQTLRHMDKRWGSNPDILGVAVWVLVTSSTLITHHFPSTLTSFQAHWLTHSSLNTSPQAFGFSAFFLHHFFRLRFFFLFPFPAKLFWISNFFTKDVPSFRLPVTFIVHVNTFLWVRWILKAWKCEFWFPKPTVMCAMEMLSFITLIWPLLGSTGFGWRSPGQRVMEWELEPHFSPG